MQEVCSVDDIGEGEMKGFEVGGEEVLVAKIEGEFYALGNVCTHQKCALSDGWLEERSVVCPCHSAKFDLATGEVERPPADEPEPTYEIETRDGKVLVDLSDV
ncbi:MAG: Rieske (2Fe-2S) protein [Candidatus Nanohaloarchaea archaeon]